MIFIKREFDAYLDEMDKITILLPSGNYNGESAFFTLTNQESTYPLEIIDRKTLQNTVKYICKTNTPISIGSKYMIIDEHDRKTDLQIGAVIRTEAFDEAFFYEKDDLGAKYQKGETTFTLWAPTASAVKIKLVAPKSKEGIFYSLIPEEKGIWRITVRGDLEGFLYTYLVCVNLVWREAVDPYAISSNINSEAAVIVDKERVNIPKVSMLPFMDATDAIIYELHVRDFSSHPKSGMIHKGKYAAFTEDQVEESDIGITGVSYLQSLGVTHVELLPLNDFGGVDEAEPDKDYNWGYNPLLFNVPEGSYALDANDPYSRILELKNLINTLHQKDLRVIMDVVYNHVYVREDSSFEKIVPGYYFRHDEHGMPSNGTGVGNDIASERKMVRKFILDSIKFWLQEYDVDGFRFDLMGILDVQTMNTVKEAVSIIKPGAIILGEGWELNTPLAADRKAMILNAKKMPGISFFNDMVRDSIKGSTFNLFDRGFALGNTHKTTLLKQTLAGSVQIDPNHKGLFLEPVQSINYVESHDNHTMWDKMAVCNSHEEEVTRIKRHRLATSVILLSQGVPFLHAGQEFFRTKGGEENSYRSPDSVNNLDWERKERYAESVDFVSGLISLRKAHKALRLSTAAEIKKHVRFPFEKGNMLMYHLSDVKQYGKYNHILIIFHNGTNAENVSLPLSGEWDVLVEGSTAGNSPIRKVINEIQVPPISTVVLAQY
ncbi:type I pullulanase [Sutcliffiella horikoshii]|uniref:Type I pullulanase n=1 Tax=Sutcliffiella horikoshii TaxID=79883 RepID=A0AA94WN99_9BACI|nr:type I pullulanase [Sutcliffiella horikoshii]TYS55639.1 type I pullulanase [Sutcliffiella horikoshii]